MVRVFTSISKVNGSNRMSDVLCVVNNDMLIEYFPI